MTNLSTSILHLAEFSYLGHVADYFNNEENHKISEEELKKKLQGYKCVLNSKATEESMVSYLEIYISLKMPLIELDDEHLCYI